MAWICDLDGVLWRGDVPIPGSVQAIARLHEAGHRVLFVSNNSSMTVSAYLAKFASIGMAVGGDDVCTSAQAAARLVEPGEKVLVLGGDGIREALKRRGAIPVEIVGADDPGGIDAVMVGMDRQIDYSRLTAAVRTVLGGARLIGTNDDPTFPAADGLNPGAGALLAAVAFAGGVDPTIAGKPHRPIAELVMERLGSGEVLSGHLLVGDQPRTDGAMATALGVPFALVLSGVTAADAAARLSPRPEHVEPDLAALVRRLVG